MFNAKQYSYNKVSDYRGRKRIWREGMKLADCGFTVGALYRVEFDLESREVRLVLDPKGDRVVSRKKKRNSDDYLPVVDLASPKLVDVTQGAQRVRVEFVSGSLRYTVHHQDTKAEEREDRLLRHLNEGTVTEGSLCAGIGVATAALNKGLAEVGVASSVSWIVDRDRRYLQVAHDNNPALTDSTQLFEASLEELEADLLSPVDILEVTLACTGHSRGGITKNKLAHAESHQTDATAVFGLVKCVEAVNPSVIVSENIVGARTSATYTLIRSMLRLLGYNLYEFNLDSAQSGSFEQRRRYWFVAVSAGLPEFDVTTLPYFERRYCTLGELLEDAVPASRWSDHDYLKAKAERDAANGKGFALHLVTEDSTKVHTIGRHYNKRRTIEPMLVREDGKERLLTPIEHCRVKDVPEEMIANLGPTLAHEGLGQGIAFNQGRGLGQWIGRSLTGAKAAVVPVHREDSTGPRQLAPPTPQLTLL